MRRYSLSFVFWCVAVAAQAEELPTYDYSDPPYEQDESVYRPEMTVPLDEIDRININGVWWPVGSMRPAKWESSAEYLEITNYDLALHRLFWYKGVTIGDTTYGWNVRGILLYVQTTSQNAQLPNGLSIGDDRQHVLTAMGSPTLETPLGVEYRNLDGELVGAYFEFDSNDLLERITVFVAP